jgi:alpha-L-fucosidase 2
MKQVLEYREPASEWLEGLPIGNGRLAAITWGDRRTDVLTLNQESVWRGANRDRIPFEGAPLLPLVRRLLQEGDSFRATALANLAFGGEGGISGLPNRIDPYQVVGELSFELDADPVLFSRKLDLRSGVVRNERQTASGSIVSEFLASCASGAFLFRWESEPETGFSGRLRFRRAKDPDSTAVLETVDGRMSYRCTFQGGIGFTFEAEVTTDGILASVEDGFRISEASRVLVVADVVTSVDEQRSGPSRHGSSRMEIEADIEEHMARFRKAMDRVNFELEEDEVLSGLDTAERIRRFKAGESDIGLQELHFHFGRYLLLSSTICGALPANLQGKWNDSIHPPWECDYHFDINLQMNYWMCEPCDMPECAEGLVQFLVGFLPSGRRAAQRLYGCRGIWLPIQTDAWMNSTPESYGWAVWIGAAPWMAWHLWQHYVYNGSLRYLHDTAYPYFQAVAEFYEDYLVAGELGVLQIMPSQSPENRFEGTGHFPVSIGISSAMDVQLAFDALTYAIDSSRILGVDEDRRRIWEDMRSRLPEFGIGRDGRLLEWNEEKIEVEPGHRHLSHLYGLYPSELFTKEKRPALHRAACASLRHRLAQGGGHTGWSRAWIACLLARSGDGEGFEEHHAALIRDFVTSSLLDLHPPRIFQIDGNLGGVAAVLEALASFHDGKVHLLHALPAAWGQGRLQGIKLPGGHRLAMEWKEHRLSRLEVIIGFDETVTIQYDDHEMMVRGRRGETIRVL